MLRRRWFSRSEVVLRWLVGIVCWGTASVAAAGDHWPGEPKDWRGFSRHEFEFDGRRCFVTVPRISAPGKPWVWRARFPEYHPEVDERLLADGLHVAYVNTDGMLGSPAALDVWDGFYELLVERHGLAPKVALEGVSRGGLFVYRWAARHPGRVAAIYADTPVCDVTSWPLGSGEGVGHGPTWQTLLREYGVSDAQAVAWRGNPIDVLAPIGRAKIPLLHIVTENDAVVPVSENTDVLARRYRALGGEITVIRVAEGTAKSRGHHFPHPDPARCADFLVSATDVFPGDGGRAPFVALRSGLRNCRAVFERTRRGRVVFLGGSITHNSGWRDQVGAALQRRFPHTQFQFVNAGIPSMGSTPGAFRLERDGLAGGGIDLLFVEAAVNDDTNGRTPQERIRGMEGIVRRLRRDSPATDIVMLQFADPGKLEHYGRGEVPPEIADHRRVAERYSVAELDLAHEVYARIDAGEFTWKEDFRNLHPSPYGQQIYSRAIRRLFDFAWEQPLSVADRVVPHSLPPALDEASYSGGRLVTPDSAALGKGFELVESWRPDRGGTRPGFVGVPMAVATEPGAELTLPFSGTAVGLFVAAGYDAGIVEVSVDGGPVKQVDLFTRWSRGLHLPWAHVVAAGLPAGEHTLTLRVAAERNEGSGGHACRIAHFLVNEPGE